MRGIGFEADKNGFALGLPLDLEPGKKWSYSNEGAQLLSPILERAAGVPLYLWWIIDDPYRFASMGFRATDCYVLPEAELVIVRMQHSVSAVPPETPYYKESGELFKQMESKH